jgi:DNA-binding transcriptional ArsR family regulator
LKNYYYLAILPNSQIGDIMDTDIQARFEARAKVIKALSHPTRLFIVDELSRGEKCVLDLTKQVGADISTVSKHLSILKNAGIVRDEKRGLQVFYSLRMPCVLGFFSCAETVMKSVMEEQKCLFEKTGE